MSKPKTPIFAITKSEFETVVWPKLEPELREELSEQAAPPSSGPGPAGGLSMNFDSLTAVVVVEMILPTYLSKVPPAEKIIKEGGYESVDDFIADIKPKLLALFPDAKPILAVERKEPQNAE